MPVKDRVRSAASRVFLVVLGAVVVMVALVALFLVMEAQHATRSEAERVTDTASVALSSSPHTRTLLASADQEHASAGLEPYVREVMEDAGLDFITVMTPAGIRLTHPNPAEIGDTYLGTIPETPQVLTEQFTGTLGPSIRTISPVLADGELVGWVAAGVTTESIAQTFLRRLPLSLGIAAVLVVLGGFGAWLARRVTRRIAGDLPPGQVRAAVSSYESLRTLGEALRAQTHEHGNRMHTAVALLELGRVDKAIDILTETARQSQELVDEVTARRHGEPAVGALLLGKASQAKERGIDWRVRIDPDTPRSVLAPVDSVSVLGNLIDNAMDAASAAPDRWISVALEPSATGGVLLEVADSGGGVPAVLGERIFEHGFSTKPAGVEGRGVGLALVRSIVAEAGGSITLSENPTRFRIVLPAGRRA